MIVCMKKERTTVLLEKPIMMKIRQLSHVRKETMSDLINLLLREGVKNLDEKKKSVFQFNPTIVEGVSPPKINISDRSELLDFLDRED